MALLVVMLLAFLAGAFLLLTMGFFALREAQLTGIFYED